jgi:hypothetical protein
MAELVKTFISQLDYYFPSDILHEVLRALPQNMSDKEADTDCPKGVSMFVRKLAKHSPILCYYNLTSLIGLFDRDNYLLRQAALKVLANVLISYVNEPEPEESDDEENSQGTEGEAGHHLSSKREREERKKLTNELILKMIIKRFNDKSSFVKSKALKVARRITEH